jgi:3-hydroxyisobutyrate dehydrogenase
MLRRSVACHSAVGFIGLGEMGSRMAPRCFKLPDCTDLFVYDIKPAAVKAVVTGCAKGKVHAASSPAEVAANSKRIICVLPNGSIVRDVFRGPRGVLSTMQADTIIIDSSTIDTDTPRELSKDVIGKNSFFCDAPASGDINAAASGNLNFVVGANTSDECARAKALLVPLSKNTVHCGPVGSGQKVKICINLILGQSMIAVSEAMLLGTKLGVDAKTLAACINSSTGTCWCSTVYNPFPGVIENVPSSRGYQGGFGASLMLKDLKLAMDEAKRVGLETPGGKNATATYTSMVEDKNMGNLDFSGISKYIDELKH